MCGIRLTWPDCSGTCSVMQESLACSTTHPSPSSSNDRRMTGLCGSGSSLARAILLMCCTCQTQKRRKIDPILLRLYGKNTEEFINRNKENRLMEFIHSNLNGAIKLYARFQNGRLEQFVVCKTCDDALIRDPKYVPKIAAATAEL